jgi:hypothetical protein
MKSFTAFYVCSLIAIFNSLLVADASMVSHLRKIQEPSLIQMKTFRFVGQCVQISLPSKNLCYSLQKGGPALGANIIPCNANDLSQRVCIAAGNGDNFLIGTRDCAYFLDNHASMDGPGLMYLEPKSIRTQEMQGHPLPSQGPNSFFFNLAINGYGMGYSGGPGPVRGPINGILQRAARQNDVGWNFVALDCFPDRPKPAPVVPAPVVPAPVVPAPVVPAPANTFRFVGQCVQISLPSKNLCYSLQKGGSALGANIVPCNANDLSQRVCIAAGNGQNFLIGTRDCAYFLDNHASMDGPGLMYLEPKSIRTQEMQGHPLPSQGPNSYFFNLAINGYGMGYSGGPGPVRGPTNGILQRAARQNDVGWNFVPLDCFPDRPQPAPVVPPTPVDPPAPVVHVVPAPIAPPAPITPSNSLIPRRRCRRSS